MYLVDTNIFLEILLEQERSNDAERFLKEVPTEHLHVSDFSLYSIGIILFKLGGYDIFSRFVEDVFMEGGVALLRLSFSDFWEVIKASKEFNLDFDGAYQYVLAKKYNLRIVSFDSDFDKTDRGRIPPARVFNHGGL